MANLFTLIFHLTIQTAYELRLLFCAKIRTCTTLDFILLPHFNTILNVTSFLCRILFWVVFMGGIFKGVFTEDRVLTTLPPPPRGNCADI